MTSQTRMLLQLQRLMMRRRGSLPHLARQFSTNDSKISAPRFIRPRVDISHNLETEHQRAFGHEAYLEEVRDDIQTITGWGVGQFKVNGNRVSGPIILTRKMVFKWHLEYGEEAGVRDLTIEDFELFTVMNPPLDLIILGTGNNIEYPDPVLMKKLRDIAPVEIVDSVNAGATFNLLTKEDRQVAAALLPVLEWSS